MIRQRWPKAEWLPAVALAALVVWAPLPFASVQEEFRVWLGVAVGLTAVLTAVAGGGLRGRGFLALVWVGAIAAGPPLWSLAEEWLQGDRASAPIGAVAGLSLRLSLGWFLMALAGGLGAAAALGRSARNVLLTGLLTGAALQIGLALYARLTGQVDTIWRVSVASAQGRLRGSYVNPDHLAFLLLIVMPLAMSFVLLLVRRGAVQTSPLEGAAALGFGLLWLLLLIGVLGSGSRAAFALAIVVSVVQLWRPLSRVNWRIRAAALVAGALIVGIPLAAAWQREGSALLRLSRSNSQEFSENARWPAYGHSVAMWLDHPWWGNGLGTFRDLYEARRAGDDARDWWHAHSDPLELLAGVGMLGVLPLVLAWCSLARRLFVIARAGPRRWRSADRLLAQAVLLSLGAGALHAAVDFPLANPANALAYVLVAAIGVGLAAGRSVQRSLASAAAQR